MNAQLREDARRLEELAAQLEGAQGNHPRLRRLMEKIHKWPGGEWRDEHERIDQDVWNRRIGPTLLRFSKPGYDPRTRALALSELESSNDVPEVVAEEVNALWDPDARVRAAAAGAIGCLGVHSAKVLNRLVELLQDAHKKVSFEAEMSLSWMAPRKAVVRRKVLSVLRGPLFKRRRGLWNLIFAAEDGFGDRPAEEQQELAEALVSVLMRLPDNRAYACWIAGDTLGDHIGGEIGFEALIRALKSPYACGRMSAIHGLTHAENPKAIPFLQEIARTDRSAKARDYARDTIAYLNGERAQMPNANFWRRPRGCVSLSI